MFTVSESCASASLAKPCFDAVVVHGGETEVHQHHEFPLSLAHSNKSNSVGMVPPAKCTNHLPSTCFASIATTMHWFPKALDSSLISAGRLIAAEFTPTLSAPDFRRISTPSLVLTPPPTVNGMSICSATDRTISMVVERDSKVAVMSKNTNSSAPFSAYCFAKATGSPASLRFKKINPFYGPAVFNI